MARVTEGAPRRANQGGCLSALLTGFAWALAVSLLLFTFGFSGLLGAASGPLTGLGAFVASAALSVAILVGIEALRRRVRNAENTQRSKSMDRAAHQLMAELSAGRAPQTSYALFLRPFNLDWSLTAADADPGDLFDVMQETIGLFSICVGEKKVRDQRFVGSIRTTDEDWREDVSHLLNSAEVVVCLPSTTPGVLWEFEQIQRSYLGKTLFVVPPARRITKIVRKGSNGRERTKWLTEPAPHLESKLREEWAGVQSMFAVRQRPCPAYDPNGAIFWFANDSTSSYPIPTTSADWSKLIHRRNSSPAEHA